MREQVSKVSTCLYTSRTTIFMAVKEEINQYTGKVKANAALNSRLMIIDKSKTEYMVLKVSNWREEPMQFSSYQRIELIIAIFLHFNIPSQILLSEGSVTS